MDTQKIIARAGQIVADNTVKNKIYNGEWCVISLIDLDGYPTSSVITPAKSDGIKHIWFCPDTRGNKIKCIERLAGVSVCFGHSGGTGDYNISLVGDIEVLSDIEIKTEMLYTPLGEMYPDGAADPNFVVLKFTAKRYNIFFGDTGEGIHGEI